MRAVVSVHGKSRSAKRRVCDPRPTAVACPRALRGQTAYEHKFPSDLKMDFRKARLLPAAYHYHIFMRCGERSS